MACLAGSYCDIVMALFQDDMCLLSGPAAGDAAFSISPSPPRCVFPLTKSQEGLWVEFQDDPTSTKYNFTLEWNLAGQGNTDKSKLILEVLKVDPEVRVIYREESALSETAVKRILRRPVDIRNQLPARWLILQDAAVTRVYIVGHHIALDGQAMTILSGEFLKLLKDPNTVLPEPADYTKMHMIELYKTSWFRVATALVGLLVIDRTRPSFNVNEVLSIGFGGRPKEMASAVGHFANALPVKVPIWQALDPSTSDQSFKSLVSALGKNLSMVKKAEMLPPIDVVRACREQGLDYQSPRVTVTYSPKLAEEECRLFPVEGSWDLFFCFLEYETDVKLGVRICHGLSSCSKLKVLIGYLQPASHLGD
nr:hybrid pks-nrps synthetase tas1 [Quercus suber]